MVLEGLCSAPESLQNIDVPAPFPTTVPRMIGDQRLRNDKSKRVYTLSSTMRLPCPFTNPLVHPHGRLSRRDGSTAVAAL